MEYSTHNHKIGETFRYKNTYLKILLVDITTPKKCDRCYFSNKKCVFNCLVLDDVSFYQVIFIENITKTRQEKLHQINKKEGNNYSPLF